MRLAFVTPRYGLDVAGGAEARVREEALGLAGRGHEVEVLTTVATDAQTWAPATEPGATEDGTVTVRRFPLVSGRDPTRRDELDHLVLSGRPLTLEEELAWVDVRFQVPALARFLTEEGGGYDAVVYSPYLFWTTLRCLPLTRARSVLIPCLHDEPLARLRVVRATLAAAADVWFQSEPEHQLAHRLVPLGPHRVVGSAVHDPTSGAPHPAKGPVSPTVPVDPGAFRRRHHLSRPFALYAGRREDGKGWPQALAGFAAAVQRHGLDLDLVTFGSGPVDVPGQLTRVLGRPPDESLRERVVDLGFIDGDEVPSAFAAATVFLQPSPNESFSRTVMEAWLAGVPVVATAMGEVVAWHCERSGGGLLYGDELEMAECIRALVDDPAAAAALGAAGRDYVRANCTWPAVLDRMESALRALASPPVPTAPPAPTARSVEDLLAAEVRERVVRDRRSELPMTPGFPLAAWLPAPGAAFASGAVAESTAASSPAIASTATTPPRAGTLRRLAASARAARRAWRAPPPDPPSG